MSCNTTNLQGPAKKVIKPYQNGFIAMNGSAVASRIDLSGLEIPYGEAFMSDLVEILPSQIIQIRAVADNFTCLIMRIQYDGKTKESERFVNWGYASDNTPNIASELLVLTGNSVNRHQNIFINNTNTSYSIIVTYMISTIDGNKTFFPTITPTTMNKKITNILFDDIKSQRNSDSIEIYDNTTNNQVAYILTSNIYSVYTNSNVLTIEDNSIGNLELVFPDAWNASQALSALSYLLKDPMNNSLPQSADVSAPVIEWKSIVQMLSDGTLLANVSYTSPLSKSDLIDLLILQITDLRDGFIQPEEFMISIGSINSTISNVSTFGTYNIIVSVNDIAGNNRTNTVKLTLI